MRFLLSTAALLLLSVSDATSGTSSSATTSRLRGGSTKEQNETLDEKNLLRILQQGQSSYRMRQQLNSGGAMREQLHTGGALRSREDRTTSLEKAAIWFPSSDVPSAAPFFDTEAPKESPTNVPTPSPTEPTEENEVCGYCQEQGCVTGTNIVDFGGGARATCDLIMSIAPKLTPFQCSIDRDMIEDICCCKPPADTEISGRLNDAALPSPPSQDEEENPCDFCDGTDFILDATIEFSSGSFASCRSFKELLDVGMPSGFCRKERLAIENACCETIRQREPDSVHSSSTTDVGPRTGADSETDHCDFCIGKEFQTNPIVTFSTGTKVSCGGVNELMDMFPQSFCLREKGIIEETCCPIPDETADNPSIEPRIEGADIDINQLPSSPLIKKDPCDFCVGHVFLEKPIIEFSIIDDSVSCGGLKTVLDTGLPESFCTSQRESIEKACCGPPLHGSASSSIDQSLFIPVVQPVSPPSFKPTIEPTGEPTTKPTAKPTSEPTIEPTSEPTDKPTVLPTTTPTVVPTSEPTTTPTVPPTSEPTATPTVMPTSEPTTTPTEPIIDPKTENISEIIDIWVATSQNASIENTTEVSTGEEEVFEETVVASTELTEDENDLSSSVSSGPQRQGFFASPQGNLDGENNLEQKQNLPVSSENNRQGFFANPQGSTGNELPLASAYKKRQGILADPVGEINLEDYQVQSPTLRDDEREGSLRKRTGLFKVNPIFDQDALKDTIEIIRETIRANQNNELLFSGGIRRGRAETISF